MSQRKTFYGGPRRPRHNQSNCTSRGERKLMLDTGKEKLFHFDLDDALAGIANQDAAGSLKGNITVKAGMLGLDETQEYLERMVSEKVITTGESERILTLLRHYSRWR
jgi:hypothetical protein